jgi:hypothetical protein
MSWPKALTPWPREVLAMNAPHPIIQGVLDQAANVHPVLRRADYVARLCRLGCIATVSDSLGDNSARDEEQRLRILRAEIDPDGALWAKHAPLRFQDAYAVHTFMDFTDTAPVTVEWVRYPHGAKVTAVVVDTVGGPKTIHNELSIGALARYQLKAEGLAAAMAAKEAMAKQGQGVAA